MNADERFKIPEIHNLKCFVACHHSYDDGNKKFCPKEISLVQFNNSRGAFGLYGYVVPSTTDAIMVGANGIVYCKEHIGAGSYELSCIGKLFRRMNEEEKLEFEKGCGFDLSK